jgi:pyridoxal phosphate enzyme (YggS family)
MHETQFSEIRDRYQQVCSRIKETTTRCGRDAGTTRLVVVSKAQSLGNVQAVIAAGATILGENYPEEAVAKINALPETKVDWHMIGHLQSRKAGLVHENFSMLHSLDNIKLAQKLNRIGQEFNRSISVLVEVNISGEESKFGFPAWDDHRWQDLEPTIDHILEFPFLRSCGLMAMPPYFQDPNQTRPYFCLLRRLQGYFQKRFPYADWSELSMGTSSDYLTAIEEGATFVRVGQAIFGPRLN